MSITNLHTSSAYISDINIIDLLTRFEGVLGGADLRGQREDLARDGVAHARPDADGGQARRPLRRLRRGRQPGQVRIHRHRLQRQAHRPGATQVRRPTAALEHKLPWRFSLHYDTANLSLKHFSRIFGEFGIFCCYVKLVPGMADWERQ